MGALSLLPRRGGRVLRRRRRKDSRAQPAFPFYLHSPPRLRTLSFPPPIFPQSRERNLLRNSGEHRAFEFFSTVGKLPKKSKYKIFKTYSSGYPSFHNHETSHQNSHKLDHCLISSRNYLGILQNTITSSEHLISHFPGSNPDPNRHQINPT